MIYLASPYTHPDEAVREYRWREACRAAAWLHLRNWNCYCPIAETHGQTAYGCTLEWEAWADRDQWFLARCDKLYVLCVDGWRESRGILYEIMQWKDWERRDTIRWMALTEQGYLIVEKEPA